MQRETCTEVDCQSSVHVFIARIKGRKVVDNLALCKKHWKMFLDNNYTGRSAVSKIKSEEPPPSNHPDADALEFDIELLIKYATVDAPYGRYHIQLCEECSTRTFGFSCGIESATALHTLVTNLPITRPLLHDAFWKSIKSLDATITKVEFVDYATDMEIFYVNLCLSGNDQEVKIDMRPSDAIIMALTSKAPIFVKHAVLTSLKIA